MVAARDVQKTEQRKATLRGWCPPDSRDWVDPNHERIKAVLSGDFPARDDELFGGFEGYEFSAQRDGLILRCVSILRYASTLRSGESLASDGELAFRWWWFNVLMDAHRRALGWMSRHKVGTVTLASRSPRGDTIGVAFELVGRDAPVVPGLYARPPRRYLQGTMSYLEAANGMVHQMFSVTLYEGVGGITLSERSWRQVHEAVRRFAD